MTNFLGYPRTGKRADTAKRQTTTEDILVVLDGSRLVGSCKFKKGKEALKHMIETLQNPGHDSKYATVTFHPQQLSTSSFYHAHQQRVK